MTFDKTLDDLVEQELTLLDNLSQLIRETGQDNLANIVNSITEIVCLRLTRNIQLMEQGLGCKIAVRLDETGIVEAARLEFSPNREAETAAAASRMDDPDFTKTTKKQ